jgi:hypothetical protein
MRHHCTDKHTIALTPAHAHYRSQILIRYPPLMHNCRYAHTHHSCTHAAITPPHIRTQKTIACTPPKRGTSTIIAHTPLRTHRADMHRADMHRADMHLPAVAFWSHFIKFSKVFWWVGRWMDRSAACARTHTHITALQSSHSRELPRGIHRGTRLMFIVLISNYA